MPHVMLAISQKLSQINHGHPSEPYRINSLGYVLSSRSSSYVGNGASDSNSQERAVGQGSTRLYTALSMDVAY